MTIRPRSSLYPLLILTLAAVMLGLGGTASAATHVRDGGGFFSPQTVQRVDQQLADLQKQRNRNVIVETFQDPPQTLQAALGRGDRNAAFATFTRERRKAESADVYVLVTRTPSHLEIATDPSVEQAGFSAAARDRSTQALVAAFKQRQFDQGLLSLADDFKNLPARSNKLTFDRPAAQTPAAPVPSRSDARPAPAPAPAPAPEKSGGGLIPKLGCFSILLIIVGVIIVVTIIRRLRGNRGGYPPQGPGGGPGGGPGFGQPGYGQPGYGQGGQGAGYNQGYGQPGAGGGGGFGRGVAGGVLGGLLGGWLGNRTFGGQQSDPNAGGASGNDPHAGDTSAGLGGSSGGDFGDTGSDVSGGDFGGGDDGGSSGGDF